MSTRLDYSKLTLMDAIDLAALIEIEAFKRYTQFAERLGSRASDDAGAVFESMAVNEGKHGEQLAERRLALFGDQRPKVKLDDIFDVEAPDVGAPSMNMSPAEGVPGGVVLRKEGLRVLRPSPPLRESAGRQSAVRGTARRRGRARSNARGDHREVAAVGGDRPRGRRRRPGHNGELAPESPAGGQVLALPWSSTTR